MSNNTTRRGWSRLDGAAILEMRELEQTKERFLEASMLRFHADVQKGTSSHVRLSDFVFALLSVALWVGFVALLFLGNSGGHNP